MKKINFFVYGFMAVVAMMMAACTPNEVTQDDTFAGIAVQEHTLQAAESCTVSFTPAYDWRLSLKGADSDLFEIVSEERLDAKTIAGTASTEAVEIVIRAADVRSFDVDYSCDVELRMNGSTKIIGNITLAHVERTLKIYMAETSEVNGTMGYNYSEDASSPYLFVYNSTPVAADQTIELFFGESHSFEHRMLVEANFDWSLSLPSWLGALVMEGSAGVTELKIMGKSQAEDVEGTMSFLDATDRTVSVASYNVAMESLGMLYTTNLAESATWTMSADSWTYYEFPTAEMGYTLQYTTATDGDNSQFVCAQTPYTISVHTYKGGSLYDITTDAEAWITTSTLSDGSFRIYMDETKGTAAAARNEMSGAYEGFVAFNDASGKTFAFIYCLYNPVVAAPVAFYMTGGADGDGSTLEELTSGEEYEAYSSYNAPVYKLTYTKQYPSMSMLKGLPQTYSYINAEDAEWLGYEYSEEYQMVSMNIKANGSKGALLFTAADGSNHCVLICELNVAE